MKDCIIPSDIADTSRWSDTHHRAPERRITSRRPDLAMREREHEKRMYKKRRRDSGLGR
jgi:hypothetical protein